MAACRRFLVLFFSVYLLLHATSDVETAVEAATHSALTEAPSRQALTGQVSAGCSAVAANVTDLCTDFLVGVAPPSPGPGSPCCLSLRAFKQDLPCICSAFDFSKLNQRAIVFTSFFCRVPLYRCRVP